MITPQTGVKTKQRSEMHALETIKQYEQEGKPELKTQFLVDHHITPANTCR